MRFLNMVIHDMRNPTVAIKLGLQDSIDKLKEVQDTIEKEQSLNSQSKKMIEQCK